MSPSVVTVLLLFPIAGRGIQASALSCPTTLAPLDTRLRRRDAIGFNHRTRPPPVRIRGRWLQRDGGCGPQQPALVMVSTRTVEHCRTDDRHLRPVLRHDGGMRQALLVVGILLAMSGALFTLQGLGWCRQPDEQHHDVVAARADDRRNRGGAGVRQPSSALIPALAANQVGTSTTGCSPQRRGSRRRHRGAPAPAPATAVNVKFESTMESSRSSFTSVW